MILFSHSSVIIFCYLPVYSRLSFSIQKESGLVFPFHLTSKVLLFLLLWI